MDLSHFVVRHWKRRRRQQLVCNCFVLFMCVAAIITTAFILFTSDLSTVLTLSLLGLAVFDFVGIFCVYFVVTQSSFKC